MKFLKLIIFFFLVVSSNFLIAQNKLDVFIEASGNYSSPEKLMPLYQYSNNWGIISPFQKSNFWLHLGGHYQFLDKKNIELQIGASAVVKNVIEESLLHQAFIRGKAFNAIDFTIGKEAYTPISYNDTLTVGGFLNNSNARPIPKIMMGVYDYLPLSFTKNWIEIRGGISHGWLNDDRTAEGKGNSADMPYLHEKWAYMRLGNTKVQPYLGLVHNSIIGGTRPNGTEIPIDYISTFLGKGSKKLGGGEESNAAGGHEGFWDFGLYLNTKYSDVLIYLQRPFSDSSGKKTWENKDKDFRLGLLLDVKDISFIKKLSIEFIKTDHQSGLGMPDPLYPSGHPKAGQLIIPYQIEDFDAFMLEVFDETTNNWEMKDLLSYLHHQQNYGYQFNGRDDYNNNGTYYNGWTYYKQPLGLPLYHTQNQSSKYAPDWSPNNHVIFKNNRVKAFHLGIEGDINSGFSYLFKYTFSKNFGAYGEQYVNRFSWIEEQDYFYEEGKNQNYSHLQVKYVPAKRNKLSLKSSFSFDFGELYTSFGVNIGLRYSFSPNK